MLWPTCPPVEIADRLKNGFRAEELPPGLATRKDVMPATVYANQIALTRENERLSGTIRELQATIYRLHDERLKGEKELNREVGRLEAQIDILKEEIERLRGTK